MNLFKVALIDEDAKMPERADGDMCFDIFSVEDVLVNTGSVAKIKTGIKIEPPEGFHFSIRPRSGLAAKHGIHILGGQIDSSYRGEIIVLVTKLTYGIEKTKDGYCPTGYKVNKGDKIAQIKFEKDYNLQPMEVKEEELSDSARGSDGFGSTGK
jgi:dUTP pyrophosphatase